MNFQKLIFAAGLFVFLISGVNAEDLSNMKSANLGSRIAMVRVCSDLATYTQNWQIKDIFDEYDKKGTAYLSQLRDSERVDQILSSLTRMQVDMMQTTGEFNWSNSCRGIIENFDKRDFL